MIKFVKIFNSKITGYWYFPENNKAPGMIEINTKTGDVEVVVELKILTNFIMIRYLLFLAIHLKLVDSYIFLVLYYELQNNLISYFSLSSTP